MKVFKFKTIFTLLIYLTTQNFISAFKAPETTEAEKKDEVSKGRLERIKKLIKENPKAAIAIVAATIIAAGGIAVGIHRGVTGRWVPWSKDSNNSQTSSGSTTNNINLNVKGGPKLDSESENLYIEEAIRLMIEHSRSINAATNIIDDLDEIMKGNKTIDLPSIKEKKNKPVSAFETLKLDKIASIAFRSGVSRDKDKIQVIKYIIENNDQIDSLYKDSKQNEGNLVNVGSKQIFGEDLARIIDNIKELDNQITKYMNTKDPKSFEYKPEYDELQRKGKAQMRMIAEKKEYDEAQPIEDDFVQKASVKQLDKLKEIIETDVQILSDNPYHVSSIGGIKVRTADELRGLKAAYAFKLAKSKLGEIIQDRDAIKIVEYFMKNPSDLASAETSVNDAVLAKLPLVKIGTLRSESPAVLRLIINAIKETNVIGETK